MPAAPASSASHLREWTTAQSPSKERLDYWVGAICEAFLEMNCCSKSAESFEGRLRHLPLEHLAVNQVTASSQEVYRSPSAIARSGSHPFYLITQFDQAWHVKQGGQQHYLRPGDMALVDAAQPYELHFPHSVACLSVQMPRAWVGQWLRDLDTRSARVVHREQGWGPLLSTLCAQLGARPEAALELPPTWLEEQFGVLLGAALEPKVAALSAGFKGLHQRALSSMQERLDQPGWTAADLSQALGVSVRTLHRAFASAGDTVTGRWRAMRVAHACTLLSQPRLARLSIAEIGLRCGYPDASHFARDFQRCMGQSPLRWAKQRGAR